MSFRSAVKKNTPKVELHSIMSLVVGSFKSGKTRLWKEVTELHYPNEPDSALLIAFEPGYETWELQNIIPILEVGSTDEEWKVWDFFKKQVVAGLVKEAKEGNKITKLIGIDTADRCIDSATNWILHDRSQKYGKKFNSLQEISEATNGAENGWTILYEEMKRQFDALRNAGYGIMVLAWTKEKETTLYDGKKYNSIELMMHSTARKVFESQASLICCLFNEVKILDKDGTELEENKKDKKGKDIATKFHETEVFMYFRPSQYIGIAGGRYTNLPDKVPYSAEGFMEVFENAVIGQLKTTKKNINQIKKEEEIQKVEKIIESKVEPVETIKETEKVFEHSIESIIEEIVATSKKLKAEGKKVSEISNVWKSKDIKDIVKVTDLDLANEILTELKAM